MTVVRFAATKGRGVHILKPGSKRRRKDAEIKEQYEYEQLCEIEARDADAQLKEKS